ncbi:MAG: TRAP transporter small permease [Desulfovibrio sp.]|jgi:TRAP-type C4-dicarboxylate transport system permease small subunit|nr:TRAP transporter small permease [Desulfovibrio sp.]
MNAEQKTIHHGLDHIALEDVMPELEGEAQSAADAAHDKFTRGINKVSDAGLAVSMYILYPAILLVILIDVVGRNFFNTPLSWAIEGSGLFLIGAIFLAVPRVELDRDHILLDILYDRYPRGMKLICDCLTRTFAGLWMLAATVRSSMEIPTSFALNESGTDFRYPFWPMRVIMTFGFLVLTLALFYNVVDSWRNYRREGGR